MGRLLSMSLLALLMHLPASEAVLIWDRAAERQLERKMTNRIPLSDADRATKERMLALLPADQPPSSSPSGISVEHGSRRLC
jgi:hypothetical protein